NLSINMFFFSSRRRHTRSDRDWSSDVCSSDLLADGMGFLIGNIYIADKEAHAIRKVTLDGNIYTVAGNNVSGYGDTNPVPATSRSEERRVGKECRLQGGGRCDRGRSVGSVR